MSVSSSSSVNSGTISMSSRSLYSSSNSGSATNLLSSTNMTYSPSSSGCLSCYNKEYYLTLLSDENSNGKNYYNISSIRIYTEKELLTHFDKVTVALRKTDDWQTRINTLELLQGIAKGGDAMKFDCFINLLKNCHELMELQILDLRSAICKEACRTVAVLSQSILHVLLSSSPLTLSTTTTSSPLSMFHYLLELWLPKLIKQTGVKIQVIALSADKAIRLIIHSFAAAPAAPAAVSYGSSNSLADNMSSTYFSGPGSAMGFPKLFMIIADQLTNSKSAVIRKGVAEYACLAAALWSTECLDKHVGTLKSIVSVGVKDADPSARRSCRQLFWLLKLKQSMMSMSTLNSSSSSSKLAAAMDALLEGTEPSAQRHIMSEYQNRDASDLSVLLRLMAGDGRHAQQPAAGAEEDGRDQYLSSDSPLTVGSTYDSVCDVDTLSSSSGSKQSNPSVNEASVSLLSSLARSGGDPSSGGPARSVSRGRMSMSGATRILPAAANKVSAASGVTAARLIALPASMVDMSSTMNASAFSANTSFTLTAPADDSMNQSTLSVFSQLSIGVGVTAAAGTSDADGDAAGVNEWSRDIFTSSGSQSTTQGFGASAAAVGRLGSSSRRMTLNAPVRLVSKSKSLAMASIPDESTPSTGSGSVDVLAANVVDASSEGVSANKENDVKRVNTDPAAIESFDSSVLTKKTRDTGDDSISRSRPPMPPPNDYRSSSSNSSDTTRGHSSQRSSSAGPTRLFALGSIDDANVGSFDYASRGPVASPSTVGSSSRSTSPFLETLKRSNSQKSLSQQQQATTGTNMDSNASTDLMQSSAARSSSRRRSVLLREKDGCSAAGSNDTGSSAKDSTGLGRLTAASVTVSDNSNISHISMTTQSSLATTVSSTDSSSPCGGGSGTGGAANTTASSALAASAVLFAQSLDSIRAMCRDSYWSTRVKAFETINNKLRLHSNDTRGGGAGVVGQQSTLAAALVDQFADLASQHISDAHLKVSQEAFVTLNLLVEDHSSALVECRNLGNYILLVFARLTDRKLLVKDSANEVINKLKNFLPSVALFTALSSKMTEISERLRLPLLQYLSLLIPFCSEYFSNSNSVYTLLNRLAALLNGSGNTSNGSLISSANLNAILSSAGRSQQSRGSNSLPLASSTAATSSQVVLMVQRILELVFQSANRSLLCTQIGLLPYQHQLLVRKLLERHVPDIDSLVASTSKQDFILRANASMSAASTAAVASHNVTMSANIGSELDSLVSVVNGSAVAAAVSSSPVSQVQASSRAPMSPQHSEQLSPSASKHPSVSAAAAGVVSGVSTLQASFPISSDLPRTAAAAGRLLVMSHSKELPAGESLDISYILSSLQFHPTDGCSSPPALARAVQWLRLSIKLASPANDEFWRINCAQIVSVLLNVFIVSVPACSASSAASKSFTSPSSRQQQQTAMTGYSPLLLQSKRDSRDISSPAATGPSATAVTPASSDSSPSSSDPAQRLHLQYVDYLHMACKSLLLLVKYRNKEIQVSITLELNKQSSKS